MRKLDLEGRTRAGELLGLMADDDALEGIAYEYIGFRQPIEAVYERFKHLDHLFSDERWLDDKRPQTHALHALWMAVRAAMEEKPHA